MYMNMNRGRSQGEDEGEGLALPRVGVHVPAPRAMQVVIAITTCIFFGLVEACHHLCIKTKYVYSITSHLSF